MTSVRGLTRPDAAAVAADDPKRFHGSGAAVLAALERHPWFYDAADGGYRADGAVFTCLHQAPKPDGHQFHLPRSEPPVAELLALPRRSAAAPWLVWTHNAERLDQCRWAAEDGEHPGKVKKCRRWAELFSTRDDFLYVDFDLGDQRLCDNGGGALPGVTLPPPFGGGQRPPRRPWAERKIDLAFLGKCHAGWYGSNQVRPWLAQAHQEWRRGAGAAADVGGRVAIDFDRVNADEYRETLAAAKVGLALPGDGRWSYREYMRPPGGAED